MSVHVDAREAAKIIGSRSVYYEWPHARASVRCIWMWSDRVGIVRGNGTLESALLQFSSHTLGILSSLQP